MLQKLRSQISCQSINHWWLHCCFVDDNWFLAWLFWVLLCPHLPLDWNISFLSFFYASHPAHYALQPRGKSSQAQPGSPESGPRHRYLEHPSLSSTKTGPGDGTQNSNQTKMGFTLIILEKMAFHGVPFFSRGHVTSSYAIGEEPLVRLLPSRLCMFASLCRMSTCPRSPLDGNLFFFHLFCFPSCFLSFLAGCNAISCLVSPLTPTFFSSFLFPYSLPFGCNQMSLNFNPLNRHSSSSLFCV